MKLTVKRKLFNEAFSVAAAAADGRGVKPELSEVLLDATREPVALVGTDLEIEARVDASGVEIEEPGKVVLPKQALKSILADCTDETLEFELKNDNIIIAAFSSDFELPTISAERFPDIEPPTFDACRRIDAEVFATMVKQTVFATDEMSTRYSLGGVYFDFSDPGVLGMVATDGRRLAHAAAAVVEVGDPGREFSPIIPKKILSVVCRAISKGNIDIHCESTRIVFRGENAVFSSRLIEGKFPRWRNVMPETEGRIGVEFIAGPLLAAVKQSRIATTSDHPAVDFAFSSGRLGLSAATSKGKSKITIPISYDGKRVVFRLDPDFVVQFLSVLDSTQSVTFYPGGDDPAYFCTPGGYEYVIMPITPD